MFLATVLAVATPPTFTPDFTVTAQSDIVVQSGITKTVAGGACCAADTPGCQLQGIFSKDKVEEQGSMQRSRRSTLCSDGPCILASLYGSVMKTMKLAPGSTANSTHEFVCNEYCPLTGPFHSEVQIGNVDKQSSRVKYMGRKSVSQEGTGAETKECDVYEWSELLFHLLPMQTTDFYVDTSGGKPVPFFSSTALFHEVFNVYFNESFLEFAAANLTGRFDIDPASFASCPLSKGCSQQGLALSSGQAFGKASPVLRTGHGAVKPPAKPLPTIGPDYVAYEETLMLSNTGGTAMAGGDICCLPSTTALNGECLVQRSTKRGARYLDVTNQRERFEDEISGETMVTMYGTVDKDMIIVEEGGVETCKEYCPLVSGETLHPLALDPNATDMGPAPIPQLGGSAERYQWSNYAKIPITGKLVKMETVEFYAKLGSAANDSTGKTTAAPVFAEIKATPYGGPQTGSQNTTYTHYTVGTPPATKFDIKGIDTCPRAKNCQLENWQAFRLAARRFDAFNYYQRY